MPTDLPGDGVGRRIRAARKLAPDLTQAALARRAGFSLSLVKAVEQGRAPASPAFVAAAGRVLGMTVFDLYDQPSPRFGEERGAVSELETAVMAGPALAGDDPPVPLGTLEPRVRGVAEMQRRSRYDASSAVMPDLLAELHTAAAHARPGAESEHAHHLLATLYGCTVICLHRLGSPLTGQAAERAATAAAGSGDPLLAALADAEIGLPLMHRGAYPAAQRLTHAAQARIADEPTSPGAVTVRGFLHLRSAILAARCGNAPSADGHLDEAAGYAAHLPELSDLYDTAFCAANVQIHSVAAAVELGDGTTAVSRDRPLPPGTMTSRLGHHHVDLARAWLLHGDRDKAFASLHAARQVAPQLTRYHPQVRETLVVLAEHDRRRTDSLAGFARWAGIRL
ncbi:MAG: helix-turn-helix domain-containing protein [Pseudonocardiaceae bacterium]